MTDYFCKYKGKELFNILLGNEIGVGREEYTVYCTRKERSGLAWFRAGIWKLRQGIY
jgi:hypothetical protein